MTFEETLRLIVREEIRAALADVRAALASSQPPAAATLMTVEQVAERVGRVTPETVRSWIHSGKLVARRPGGRRFAIDPVDLDRFLANERQDRETISVEDHLKLVAKRVERATGT